MTTCRVCAAPVPSNRRVYCSETCREAGRLQLGRERYHSDAAFAEAARARSRAWNEAHRQHKRDLERRRYLAAAWRRIHA